MIKQSTVAIEHNSYDDTWEIGWRWDDGEFTPGECGYTTKEEAEAEMAGFEARIEERAKTYQKETEEQKDWENERWPRIGYARVQIGRLFARAKSSGKGEDLLKAFNARDRLVEVMDMDLHEYIDWPLPPDAIIEKGSDACKEFWRNEENKRFRRQQAKER